MKLSTMTAASAAVITSAALGYVWLSGMSTLAEDILGSWKRSSTSDCAARYPSEVSFEASGIYKAPTGVETGAIWHGGDWEIRENTRVALQLANDRMELYTIAALTADEVRLVDADGCEITFVRD